MMFGQRLRELRKERGISQKELAKKVGIDFTYLSKIETGSMDPPSEKTILALAKALNADSDELLVLAKKIPSDLAEQLDLEAIRFLRSHRRKGKEPGA